MVKRTTTRSHHKSRRLDDRLLIAYLITLAVGLVVVYSTSSMIAESRFGSHLFFFKNQVIWSILSLIAIAVIVRIDLERFAVYSWPLFILTLGMLAMVFLMPARNESQRWLFLGPFTVQPSELFKFVMIYYLAFSLANRNRDITKLKQFFFPYVPMIGAGLLLIVLEPDLGTTIVIFATAVTLFFLAGAKIKHLVVAAVPTVTAAAVLVFGLGYKEERVTKYMSAILDPLQGSYQSTQAALTLGAGGFFGAGLGDGRQKLFFLPYPHTDFIFAAAGEELGFLGSMVLLGLLGYMIYRGFKIAYAQPDRFGYLLAAGMTLSLFINIAVNIGVVTSLLPVTGLPLPFISYGGSSLLISSVAIGVLLNLSRRVQV